MPRRSGRRGGGAKADGGAAAAPASELVRVDGIKGRLATLCTHEVALDVELSELQTVESRSAAMKRVKTKRDAVRAEIETVECELDAAVNAPVSGGRDPTEWLPDELMLMIMMMLPFTTLWSGACERVCQRWAQLMESASIELAQLDCMLNVHLTQLDIQLGLVSAESGQPPLHSVNTLRQLRSMCSSGSGSTITLPSL